MVKLKIIRTLKKKPRKKKKEIKSRKTKFKSIVNLT